MVFCSWRIVIFICFKMVRSCGVKVCNSELHDRKGQKLTTKKDILGFTLEKKTKQQEASPRRWPGLQQ